MHVARKLRLIGSISSSSLYFADAQGSIRHHVFGEGEYEQSERVLQQLLTESGSRSVGKKMTPTAEYTRTRSR